MQKISVFEVHGVRVLTTRQLASMYETDPEIINNNFIRNKQKYVLEKHYISISGEEMRLLKTSHQFDGELKRVSRAYFWTEKGALLHAKSLNTDKAWEVYDYLVDFYFRAKEKAVTQEPVKKEAVLQEKAPAHMQVVDVPENPKIQKALYEAANYNTALQVMLKEYNRYNTPGTSEQIGKVIHRLSLRLSDKVLDVLEVKPKIIPKKY